jgi:hypothetical protein
VVVVGNKCILAQNGDYSYYMYILVYIAASYGPPGRASQLHFKVYS